MEDRVRLIGFARALSKTAQGAEEVEPDQGKGAVKKLLLGMASLPVIALGGRSVNRFLGRTFPKAASRPS